MERDERPKVSGLKWRERVTMPDVPVWIAKEVAKNAGFRPKSVQLDEFADNAEALKAKCDALNAEMALWMRDNGITERIWDGSFKALLELYQTDPKSPYKIGLKPGTVKAYTVYLNKLIRHIGALYIAETDGRDEIGWFAEWRVGPKTKKHPEGKDQLAAACMALAVLKAAVSWGIVCRKPGIKEFQDVLGELEFETPDARDQAPTAEQIIAARLAAHKNGNPRRALLYAFQMDTTGRQWDWTGIWVPHSDPRMSDVIDAKGKWFGPRWSDIDENMILNIKPTKTEGSTAVEITFDLSECPMVMEEIANIPVSERVGPLIINERTGQPYRGTAITDGWRKDYALAGLPDKLWNRDTRAGAITERRLAGASQDDRRRLAGHAKADQTGDYERGAVDLEAHRNVMRAVRQFREKNSK